MKKGLLANLRWLILKIVKYSCFKKDVCGFRIFLWSMLLIIIINNSQDYWFDTPECLSSLDCCPMLVNYSTPLSQVNHCAEQWTTNKIWHHGFRARQPKMCYRFNRTTFSLPFSETVFSLSCLLIFTKFAAFCL